MKVYMDLQNLDASYAVSNGIECFAEYGATPVNSCSDSEDAMAKVENHEKLDIKLKLVLQQLDPELRAILEAKFGLNSNALSTNDEVAQKLGGTIESLAALEELALRSLYLPAKKRA